MSSIFTKILNGEIPGEIVKETNNFFVLLDINPVNHGHLLVISKEEYEDLSVVPNDLLAEYLLLCKEAGKTLLEIGADGFNVLFNTKKAAGQIIFHVHAHVIPRFEGDGFKMWQGEKAKEKELKAKAEEIRKKWQ